MLVKSLAIGMIVVSMFLVGCEKDENVVEEPTTGTGVILATDEAVNSDVEETEVETKTETVEENSIEKEKNVEKEKDTEKEVAYTPAVNTTGLDNKKVGWSFGYIEARTAELCEKYGAIYSSKKQDKSLYLTFDEGYENGYTGQILDTLKDENVPAAFFITGPYIQSQSDLVKRMVDEGHVVGNHTWSHPSMPDWSDEKLIEDIKKLSDAYTELTGKTMKFLRPPQGDFSERTLALMKSLGYTAVFWKFAYSDWDPNNQKGTEYAYTTVTNKVKDGDIILLHAVSKDNANALSQIINYYKEQGYTFKSLNDFS